MPLTLSGMCRSIASSVTLAIDSKAKAMKASGVDVIGFGAGEPDFDTPKAIRDAAHTAIEAGKTRYTPSSGIAELRATAAAKLLRDNGLTYTPEQIIVTTGAKHALLGALLALINPGDEVIIPTPCWVSYPEMVRMAGGKPVFAAMVQSRETNGFVLSIENVRNAVTPKTKAILINSPHNPTGMVLTRDELEELAKLAVRNEFYVISDEIYEKLVYDGAKHISIASLGDDIYRQTIVINGVSKSYAMTGWRIGYAAAPLPIIKLMGSYQSHATSNPTSIAQWASVTAINDCEESIETMRQAFEARRVNMLREIESIQGLSCAVPQGAFYIMLNMQRLYGKTYDGNPIMDAMTFSALLLEYAHVAVVPGEAFEAPGTCRLSYACSQEDITRGMERIRKFVSELK
ncbi:MAG: pyridoxal phosphate-dependent aminotransferase [Oscillospiraceae bacterium]|jgi:aspartate aminotransferase|nr:pyridoxal phosphate-dependent aminotransferase [Oscillospiraceae bacterium]